MQPIPGKTAAVFLAVLALLALLAGCAIVPKAPAPETRPTQPTVPAQPEFPAPADLEAAANTAELEAYLFDVFNGHVYGNILNFAFESPLELDMAEFLALSLDAEDALYNLRNPEGVPREILEHYFAKYFGCTLEQLHSAGALDGLQYLPETDCYCIANPVHPMGGACPERPWFADIRHIGDTYYVFYYNPALEGDFCLQLKASEGNYHILANTRLSHTVRPEFLEYFQTLLNYRPEAPWVNASLAHNDFQFQQPYDQIFANGFGQTCTLTEAEIQYLRSQGWTEEHFRQNVYRLPRDAFDDILRSYFDALICPQPEQLRDFGFIYWEQTGAYYFSGPGAAAVDVTVERVQMLPYSKGESYYVYYTNGQGEHFRVELWFWDRRSDICIFANEMLGPNGYPCLKITDDRGHTVIYEEVSQDHMEFCVVTGLDPQGAPLWTHRSRKLPTMRFYGDRFRSIGIVDDAYCYWGDGITALDLTTGKPHPAPEFILDTTLEECDGSVLVQMRSDSSGFISGEENYTTLELTCLDAQGQLRWHHASEPVYVGEGTGGVFAIGKHPYHQMYLYVAGDIVALDSSTGEELWRVRDYPWVLASFDYDAEGNLVLHDYTGQPVMTLTPQGTTLN